MRYTITICEKGEKFHLEEMSKDEVKQWIARNPKAVISVSEWSKGEYVRQINPRNL